MDDPSNLGQWNLRPFPKDIKQECNARAGKEGKKDWEWLADYLRKVLPLIQTSNFDVLDSEHESRKEEIRRGSQQTDTNGTPEAIRNQTRQKAPT
jgi:hypothetical protein